MIPAIKPERILSRAIFELNFGAGQSFSQSVFEEVSKEVSRLLPSLISINLHHHQNSSSTTGPLSIFTLVHHNNTNIALIEAKDSRVAGFLCDVLEDRRVLRLSSGGGKCQLSWFVGGTTINGKEYASYSLPEPNERAQEEMRMNIDEELWGQAAEGRRQDVLNWLRLYSGDFEQHQQNQQDVSMYFNLESIELAFVRATNTLFNSSMTAAQKSLLERDPFKNGFFLGAFDGQDQPTLISSMLPLLSNDVKPSAKQLASMIAKTKNVYFRSLCLLYLRYRCSPENIVSFFANIPPKYSKTIESTDLAAPSIFSSLGNHTFEADNSNSPLLDNSLIQTSLDGSTTTTMKQFARSLLLEDELVELWLPTYTESAVERLSKFIDFVDEYHFEVLEAKKKIKTAADVDKKGQHHMKAQRREREDEAQNQHHHQKKPANSASSSSLLAGLKSVSQLAALLEEQKKAEAERKEIEKQKQLEEEEKLRRQYAGTADEQVQRREVFQRQAAALKDRRRREILERLQTSAGAKERSNTLLALSGGASSSGGKQQHQAYARDQRNMELISILTANSSSSSSFSTSDHQPVVHETLLNQSVAYFGLNPPTFASLPPFYGGDHPGSSSDTNKKSKKQNQNPQQNSSSSLANLCSTTTVGTEDMFVCF